MDNETRFELIARNTAEIVEPVQLKGLLESGSRLKGYIGFEPSGYPHIGQGLITSAKVKDMQDAGVEMTIYLADWFAYINEKLGGVMENIVTCGDYMKECFIASGIEPGRTKYIHSTDLVRDIDYWRLVLDVGQSATLSRVARSLTIMGRQEGDEKTQVAKYIYPLMQVADILYMDLDIAYAGMDQRKAHMLMRDIAEKLKRKKAVAVHTPLISSLVGSGRMEMDVKMSKSRPETAVFLHDPDDEIVRKITKGFCPEKVVEQNPIVEIAQYIVFPFKKRMRIERDAKFGGDVEYDEFPALKDDYIAGKLHPMDLKKNVAREVVSIVAPIREKIIKTEAYKKMREIK
jgi:tyrosyl-tRNA synthetase